MTNPDWTVKDLWGDQANVFVEHNASWLGQDTVVLELQAIGNASPSLAYTPEAARELAAVLNQAATAAEE